MIRQIRTLLTRNDLDKIPSLAERHKRILSYLTALTYDPDNLVSWRSITALGLSAGVIAEKDPEYVRIHLRRLMWLLNDESGGIGWRAPEAMGEIIRSRPELFGEFIPILVSILDMEPEDAPPFRAGTLWALGRLASIAPSQIESALPNILICLVDSDPQTRGMAIWCLSQMQSTAAITNKQDLLKDENPVLLYQDGQIFHFTVG
ncbi:MAG TPA: HEAT repeat domain-containing protein, partial [Anaerolineales bacterium]|nr:HEAT repeat domain-containing protein [Anaerolineales bacterium]